MGRGISVCEKGNLREMERKRENKIYGRFLIKESGFYQGMERKLC